MNNTFFSIIIPTYNRADLVTIAISSVLNQTYQDFEIIIVDDGSTDNTEEVVKDIMDSRVKYFYKDNEERSIARNFGIQMACGKYIGFLDADDYFLENHLKVIYDFISTKSSVQVVHTGYEFRNENGDCLKKVQTFPESVNQNILIDNPLICNSIIINQNLFREYQFINNKSAILAEDWYLWIVLASNNQIHLINKITTIVVQHANRSLNKLNPHKILKSIDLVVNHLLSNQQVVLKYGKRNLCEFATNRYMFSAYTAMSQNKHILFLISLFKAFRYSPKYAINRLITKIKDKP